MTARFSAPTWIREVSGALAFFRRQQGKFADFRQIAVQPLLTAKGGHGGRAITIGIAFGFGHLTYSSFRRRLTL